ncbi:MAG: hypothetical protein HUU46_20255, partial [Candidatus Hydrogenedentes bacterium]|nr:hypothetical protein [Candidatus Hydrogenedentota bacterium]
MRRLILVVLGVVGVLAFALAFSNSETYAALPAEAQLPVGIPVTVTLRNDAGSGTFSGTLVAADEQWLVLRDDKSLLHWYTVDSIRNVDSGPAPAPAEAAPAPAP